METQASLLTDTGFWVLGSFLVFMFVAWKYGRSAILGKLDQRIEEIRTEIETADNLRVEAQELLAEYQRKQLAANQDAEDIVTHAKQQASELKKQAKADLKDITARREAQLAEKMQRLEEKAVQDIKNYAADITTTATMNVLAKELGKKQQAELIDGTISFISNGK